MRPLDIHEVSSMARYARRIDLISADGQVFPLSRHFERSAAIQDVCPQTWIATLPATLRSRLKAKRDDELGTRDDGGGAAR